MSLTLPTGQGSRVNSTKRTVNSASVRVDDAYIVKALIANPTSNATLTGDGAYSFADSICADPTSITQPTVPGWS